MHSTCIGKLHILWRDGQGPSVDRDTLARVYETVYLPTLARDIVRLHEAFETCLRADSRTPENPLGFNTYAGAVIRHKRAVGAMALATTDDVEARYVRQHDRFISATQFEDRTTICACLGTPPLGAGTQVDVTDATFTEARLACIGYDTSATLNDISNHLLSEAGMAQLYIAKLQGDASLTGLLTRKWPAHRKNDDTKMLAGKIYQLSTALHTVERIRAVQDSNPDIPCPKIDTFKLVQG